MYRHQSFVLAEWLSLTRLLFFTALFSACSADVRDGQPEHNAFTVAASTESTAAPTRGGAATGLEAGVRYLITSLKMGAFYFELSEDGPVLVPSPAEASLSPFVPWTQSRHISRILPLAGDDGEALYAAVNRSGILRCAASGGETTVSYTTGGESWKRYSIAAFFRYNQKPAALLARDRFFSEEEAPPPFALWTHDHFSEHPSIKMLSIPALETEQNGFRETAGLLLGRDGGWYIRKFNAKNGIAYFRTGDLSRLGAALNVDAYLKAAAPFEPDDSDVPRLLARVLDEAARLAGTFCVAAVVSPAFPAERLFGCGNIPADALAKPAASGGINAPAEANAENAAELSGYYRPPEQGGEEAALVLFRDGWGVYGFVSGGVARSGSFALPALPSEDFTYTGIALLEIEPERNAADKNAGNILFASWEEQKNWNVGASGFVLLEFSR